MYFLDVRGLPHLDLAIADLAFEAEQVAGLRRPYSVLLLKARLDVL